MVVLWGKSGDKRLSVLPYIPIEIEADLRDQIMENPELIPMDEIEEGVTLKVVAREMRVFEQESDKFIDAAGLDAKGNIYIIETKLTKNNDKRKVVAQILNYGGALWAYGPEFKLFIDRLDSCCREAQGMGLGEFIHQNFGFEGDSYDSFISIVASHYEKGEFRFVVYVDKVWEDLKNQVAYINESSKFKIYLVDVEQYGNNEVMFFVPRVWGKPARVEAEVSRITTGKMDEARFLEIARSGLGDGFSEFSLIFNAIKEKSGDSKSFRATERYNASYTPKFLELDGKGPFSLKADGTFQFYFDALEKGGFNEYLDRLKASLTEIGLDLPKANNQPSFTFENWRPLSDQLKVVLLKSL